MIKIRKRVRVFNGEPYRVFDPVSYLKTKKEVTKIKASLKSKGHRVAIIPTGEKFIIYASIEVFPIKKKKEQVKEKERTQEFFNLMPTYIQKRISKKYKISEKNG